MKLSELRKIAEAATPGPWKADIGNWQIEQEDTRDGICTFSYTDRDGMDGGTNKIDPIDDANFIAEFNPALALELIGLIEKSREMAKYYDGVHNQHWAIDFNTIGEPVRDFLEALRTWEEQ